MRRHAYAGSPEIDILRMIIGALCGTVGSVMHFTRKLNPAREQIGQALGAIGGEPLEGSGFSSETPEDGFSASSVALGPGGDRSSRYVPGVSGGRMRLPKQRPAEPK
jgi:hypothetical protein